MSIDFTCPCGAQLHAKDKHAGKKVRCPSCKTLLSVPAASEAVAGQESEESVPAASETGAGQQSTDTGSPASRAGVAVRRRTIILGSASLIVLVGAGIVVYFLWLRDGASRNPNPNGAGKTTKFEGNLEKIDLQGITGWIWDPARPDTPLDVEIYDGDTLLVTLLADKFRTDLLAAGKGDGKHGFRSDLPQALRDGRPHTVRAKVPGTVFQMKREKITVSP